ncbi:MAG: protein involved in polysaccharide export with SLBB domain [Bacteroidia bacterium]|jgi:protein involved in polysaccharide export with SLBB domain
MLPMKFTTRLKQSIFFLCLLSVTYQADAQTSSSSGIQADNAIEQLENRGINGDEVKKALKKKGIDLDNLRPEQVATLEDDIKLVVTELEAESNDEVSGPVKDANTSLTNDIDSTIANKLEENVTANTEEISQAMKDGASLEEALSSDLSKKLAKKYSVKTNIYGHHIFYDNSIDLFTTTSSSTTPNTYVLDVGDKIAINIFGASQADLLYEIDIDGFVRPSGMYKIYLKGITIAKAKDLLRNRFAQAFMFDDGQFNVDLHTARTININLFGEVNQPGSYTISALNTALNAIVAAGGITSEAGIRNIRIISSGKERVLDVYDFVANPKLMYDFYLQNNDIIYVSKWKKLVTARGKGFRTAARFELRESEDINDVLIFSQGLTSKAYTSVIKYTTFNGEEQILKNYALDEMTNGNIKLQDGDIIDIGTSSIAYENFVQINGSVRHPGKYEFSQGDKVYGLLDMAYLEEETFSELAYLKRKNVNGTFKLIRLYVSEILNDSASEYNIALQKEDVISLYGKSSFVDTYDFSISGAVRAPSTYFYDPEDNITVYDAIIMSKGLKANATEFGYIIGAPTDNNLEKNYTVINVAEILSDPSSAFNIKIKANDNIVIPAKELYMEQFTVSLSGAVKRPGEFVYDASLSVKDMLIMAGGLKMEAASNKVDVFRLDMSNENEPTKTTVTSIVLNRALEPYNQASELVLQPYDHIVVRSTPEYEPIKYVHINGEVRYPGLYAIMEDNETISTLVERAGGVTAEGFPEAASFMRTQDSLGFVVTRIDKAIAGRQKFDITVKQGDVLTIPKLIDVVKIDRFGTNASDMYSSQTLGGDDTSGTLNLVVNFQKKRANWYIKEFAGGYDKRVVKKSKTKVIYPNGQTKKTIALGLFNIYPKVRRGSEIVLSPNKRFLRKLEKQMEEDSTAPSTEKKTFMERLSSMQAIVSISTAMTTSALTVAILLDRLDR